MDVEIKRGQVWYIDDKKIQEKEKHIQRGTRPWLVVSNDKANKYSSIIHMAPITTQSKKLFLPTHVVYKYSKINRYEEAENVILCEQLQLKTEEELRELGIYCYTLSPFVMNKVNRALAIQLDIPGYNKILDFLSRISKITLKVLDEKKAEEFYKRIGSESIDILCKKYIGNDEWLEGILKNVLSLIYPSVVKFKLTEDIKCGGDLNDNTGKK